MKFTFAPESRPLDGYTIKRAIHRGGFGEVYYALSDAGKEVALKLLNNNLEVELRGVSQCLNLKHPNLVTIFDIRQDSDKDHWIVMEYVSGRGLYDVLRDNPAGMPINDVLSWLAGITAGLSFLHDCGIVHRDLKPANVFSEAGVVKLGDVGLSKFISESRRSAQTQSVGTVYYMAPEVARGRYGREVDVYALGVMTVEMLTGHVPFDGETTAEILMKHLTAEPDLTGVPQALHAVLKHALEKDPAKRIADADEFERQFRLAAQELAGTAGHKAAEPIPRRGLNAVFAANGAAGPGPASAKKKLQTAMDRGRSVRERSREELSGVWQPALNYWQHQVPTPIKWILGGALFFAMMESGLFRMVAPGAVVGGLGYVSWKLWKSIFGNRSVVRNGLAAEAVDDGPAVAAPPTAAAAHGNLSPPAAHAPPQFSQARYAHPVPQAAAVPVKVYTPATPRQIPLGQRTTDITSSMSVALLAVALVTTAVHLATDLLPDPVQVVYFGMVTLVASWVLIVPAKLWEGKASDGVSRRIVQGSLGLGVGAFAYMLKEFLLLNDHSLLNVGRGGLVRELQAGRISIATMDGLPTMAGFMVFFGLLFSVRRWWWQIDSFRKSRFRVSSAMVTLILGAVLTGILPFPEELGATWALAISAVVQLASGWTPQEERRLVPAPESARATPMLASVRHPVVTPHAAQPAAKTAANV